MLYSGPKRYAGDNVAWRLKQAREALEYDRTRNGVQFANIRDYHNRPADSTLWQRFKVLDWWPCLVILAFAAYKLIAWIARWA